MTRSAQIAVAAALLLAVTPHANAKSRGAAGSYAKPLKSPISETVSHPTTADPYYRLSDFYAVPPYSPGYSYGHVKPSGWR